MGIAKKTDGRYVVGVGVDNANDYRGSAAYRDIYIQLTSSGATAKSEEYLTFLKDYGFHANSLGEPIMPPSVNVWISNNGVTTAVEADDVSIDGSNYTICGIKWNGSVWDLSGAGQGKSGSGLPPYTSADKGKSLTLGEGDPVETAIVPEQSVTVADGAEKPTITTSGTISAGDSCVFTVNNVDYTTTAFEDSGGVAVAVGNYFALVTPHEGINPYFTAYSAYQGRYFFGTYAISISASVPSVEPKWEAKAIVTFSNSTSNAIMQAMQTAIPTALGGSTAMFDADLTSVITDAERTAVKTACANAIERGKGSLVMFAGGVATPTSYASDTASVISFLIPNYAFQYSGVTYTLRITLNIRVNNSSSDAASAGILEMVYQMNGQ